MSGKPEEGDGSPEKKESSPKTKSDDEERASEACEVTCQPDAELSEPESPETVKEEMTDERQESKETTSPTGMIKKRIIASSSEACDVTCQPDAEPMEPELPETVKEEMTDERQESKEITSPIGMIKMRIIAACKAKAIDQDAAEEPGVEENQVASGSENEAEEKAKKYITIQEQMRAFFASKSEFNSGFAPRSEFSSGYATRQATRQAAFIQERERFYAMTVDEKRKLYANSDYVTLEDIETWPEFYSNNVESLKTLYPDADEVEEALELFPGIEVDDVLNGKVSLFEGDITTLEIDGIVNAANSTLLGGGGVDGAIHRAAGPLLTDECRTLHGCETGDAKTTCGYRLPAKYVIHTVGPTITSRSDLQRCYVSCFREMAIHNMKSIAFCCISTGIYGYPNDLAGHDALMSTRKYLTELKGAGLIDSVERIIFCLYLPIDVEVYQSWMQVYFPTEAVSISD